MTNKKAIEILKVERDEHINRQEGVTYVTRTEAINMAIKALETIDLIKFNIHALNELVKEADNE